MRLRAAARNRGITGQQREALKVAITALLAVLLSLPFTLFHPVLPYVIVLSSVGLVLMMQRWRWLANSPTAFFAGCLVALVMLLPTTYLVNFMEQGFDDGPFYGTTDESFTVSGRASDRLDFRQGELLVYNRQADQVPALVYRVDGDARWTTVLDIHQNPRYEGYQLSSIEEPRLVRGLLRDRLDFRANWSFGDERGRAYIWKWGGLHRFFLSW